MSGVKRWTCIQWSGLVLVLGATVALPAVATAAVPGTIVEDAARALPEITHVRPPVPVGIHFVPPQEIRYGTTDQRVITALDEAKDSEVAAIDETAGQVAADSEAKELIKGCIKESLQGAAGDYAEAERNGTEYPSFDATVSSAATRCLAQAFPDAPPAVVDEVAAYIAGRTEESAVPVAQTEPTAFVNWLSVTGEEVGTPSPTPDPPPPSDPAPPAGSTDGGGSSFPWWLVGVAALVVAGIAVVSRSGPKS
jgi:hypothetical protein